MPLLMGPMQFAGDCLPRSRLEIGAHVPCGILPLVTDAAAGRNVLGSAGTPRVDTAGEPCLSIMRMPNVVPGAQTVTGV